MRALRRLLVVLRSAAARAPRTAASIRFGRRSGRDWVVREVVVEEAGEDAEARPISLQL